MLEGGAAGQREGEVGKVAGAGTADARLLDGEYAGDLATSDKAAAGLGGDLIHERADGFVAEMKREAQNHKRDDDGGEGVGIAEPADAVCAPIQVAARPTRTADGDPDVGAKWKASVAERGCRCAGRRRETGGSARHLRRWR